jgi:acyl-coenzyme A synthetase/AMP-(fatty) acid ligase
MNLFWADITEHRKVTWDGLLNDLKRRRTYNPTHMAGIQVFFEALLNPNTMVRLFGLAKDDVFRAITKYNITHISATPTFYRLLLLANKVFMNVNRITSGGEKFDTKTTV